MLVTTSSVGACSGRYLTQLEEFQTSCYSSMVYPSREQTIEYASHIQLYILVILQGEIFQDLLRTFLHIIES